MDAETPSADSGERAALRLILTYAVFAGLWIWLSDRIVAWLFSDPDQIALVSTIKGWLFVAVTSLLLYGLIWRLLNRLRTASRQENAARRLLVDIADCSPDAIFVKDLDGRYLLVNQEVARVLGKTPEQIIGSDDTALFPEAQAASIRANDLRTIAGMQVDTYEETASTVDGERIYHSIKRPLHDSDGNAIGLIGICRDITELKRVQADLQDREFKLSSIVGYSPSVLSLKHPDGRYALANPNFQRIHHCAEENIIGKTDFELYPKDAAERLRANDELVLHTRTRHSIEEILPVDGQPRTFMSHIFAVPDAAGEVRFICRISLDITERKRAEEALLAREQEFSAFFHSNAYGAAMIGLDRRFVRVNERFCDMVGYPAEELLQMNCMTVVHPDDTAQIAELIAYLHGKTTTYKAETRYIRKDGQTIWVQVDAALIRDGDGKALYSTGTIQDITARKLAEERLKAAMAEVNRANNAKSRFLAAASHDLRQPLAALGIYVKMLQDKATSDDRTFVGNMQHCIASLSALLNDLLDLSKLEAGVVTPNISNFPVAALLSGLDSIHAPQAAGKNLRLRCRPSRRIVRTDPILFKRIMANLIDNAIRYTERGGILVACRWRGGKHWIEVRDSGIGIPADKTMEIFEEFKQLGDDARNNGSGLGLAIVAKTATLLGLEIRVHSRPGHGSVFAIELPLGRETRPPGELAHEEIACCSLRIGFVEDNLLVREALSLALRNRGHQVVAAASGPALLAELGTRPPDVIVSDYRLGHGETGLDVVSAVRERMGTRLPAIIITGDTDPAVIARMAQWDIVVLHKPLDVDELQAHLNEI